MVLRLGWVNIGVGELDLEPEKFVGAVNLRFDVCMYMSGVFLFFLSELGQVG